MNTEEPEELEADEHAFAEAIQQLADRAEPSLDFSQRVLNAARQTPLDSPPKDVVEFWASAPLRSERKRSSVSWFSSVGLKALAAILFLSLGLNGWLSYYVQRETSAPADTVAAVPPSTGGSHDLRSQSFTTIQIAQAMFPADGAQVFTRDMGTKKPGAASTRAVVLGLNFAPHAVTDLAGHRDELEKLGHVLTLPEYAAHRIQIVGHTDEIEAKETQHDLSRERAQHVKQYLVQRFAINTDRIEIEGRGASQPQTSNETPEGRRQNRRVEVFNLGSSPRAN